MERGLVMAREKIVREDVAHVWAHQLQGEARNRGGNLYFRGEVIYSYGSHFPIARHVEHKGKKCILFTTQDYSRVTAGHKWEVQRAIPSGVPVFHVQHPTNSVRPEMADEYTERITAKLEEAAKARQRRPYLLNEAQLLVVEAREFCKFFGIRRKFRDVGNIDEIKAELDAIKKRKAAALSKRQREQAKKDAERLEKWLAGEANSWPSFLEFDYLRLYEMDDGSQAVQTTRRVVVPLKDVKKIAKLVLRHVRSGEHWQKNGEHIKVGDYELDYITSDGTIGVGCHKFKREEVLRFAGVLGIA